jgi:hypothetical protein
MRQAEWPHMAEPWDILLSPKETCRRLGVGPTTLNKFVHLGWLTKYCFSKRLVRYRAREVQAFIEAATKKGGQQ